MAQFPRSCKNGRILYSLKFFDVPYQVVEKQISMAEKSRNQILADVKSMSYPENFDDFVEQELFLRVFQQPASVPFYISVIIYGEPHETSLVRCRI